MENIRNTKIIFLTQFGKTGPSSRFRTYQFEDLFKKYNLGYRISPAIPDWLMRFVFPPKGLKKIIYFLYPAFKRLFQFPLLSQYDVIIIQKAIIPKIYPLIEILISRKYKNTIFDMDDAVWISSPLRKEKPWVKLIKNSRQTELILKSVNAVSCGNSFLLNYSKNFNVNSYNIPTCVNPAWYKIKQDYEIQSLPKVGWIGTDSTINYFKEILSALEIVYNKFKFELLIVGSHFPFETKIPVRIIEWRLEKEAELIVNFDIGLMPLVDDIRSKGKCGAKLLQYLISGIPSISSPVGVSNEIIKNGLNGILASDTEEWSNALMELIQNQELREKFGKAGRNTILREYSVEAVFPTLLNIINSIHEN